MGLLSLQNNRLRAIVAALIILVPLILTVVTLPLNPPYTREQALGFAIFISIVVLWVTEIIPLPVTALLVPVLAVGYGILPLDEAFRPFSKSIIFLFLGAFFLAQAMHKHQLDQRIAYSVLLLPLGRHSIAGLSLAIGGVCFVLSMWISNTITVAMMCPVMLGVASVLSRDFQAEQAHRITTFLLLLIAYSSSVGGIATPVGSPPNLITIAFLKEEGLNITFFNWMAFALPIAIVLFATILGILFYFYWKDIRDISISALAPEFEKRKNALGPLSSPELTIAYVFLVTTSLWILPGIFSVASPGSPMTEWVEKHIPMSVVALASGISLFLLPAKRQTGESILLWIDAKKIDWGTIILFGGGLCLGSILEQTELSKHIGHCLFGGISDNPLLLTAVAATTAILLTEVASNTASATVLVALLLGILPSGANLDAYGAVLAACLATSCSFMLPVATPPNAIVFGTEKVPLAQMLRIGFLLNILALCIIVVAVQLLFAGSI